MSEWATAMLDPSHYDLLAKYYSPESVPFDADELSIICSILNLDLAPITEARSSEYAMIISKAIREQSGVMTEICGEHLFRANADLKVEALRYVVENLGRIKSPYMLNALVSDLYHDTSGPSSSAVGTSTSSDPSTDPANLPTDLLKLLALAWGNLIRDKRYHGAAMVALVGHFLSHERSDEDLEAGSKALLLGAVEGLRGASRQRAASATDERAACSFCDRGEPEVRLVALARAFICDSCFSALKQAFDTSRVG